MDFTNMMFKTLRKWFSHFLMSRGFLRTPWLWNIPGWTSKRIGFHEQPSGLVDQDHFIGIEPLYYTFCCKPGHICDSRRVRQAFWIIEIGPQWGCSVSQSMYQSCHEATLTYNRCKKSIVDEKWGVLGWDEEIMNGCSWSSIRKERIDGTHL